MSNTQHAAIVAALIGKQKRKRGRPRKDFLQDIDSRRAFFVLYTMSEHPGRFRNRREVIDYLTRLALAGRDTSLTAAPEDKGMLLTLFRYFTKSDIEQSLSRGMNANDGVLKAIEKLAKKSKPIIRK